ncbi:MAG: methyltransferase domain-containing protein [Saprospiraceae bacterium]
MAKKLGPFDGVLNIVRFNWHFYLVAFIILLGAGLTLKQLPEGLRFLVFLVLIFTAASLLISLLTSFYVYDLSNLYQLPWISLDSRQKVLNVNAGFDETSSILLSKFPDIKLTVADFYNPQLHTEVSIKRARSAYPPFPGTHPINTNKLTFPDGEFDASTLILSAHEIREHHERIQFFKEINRVTKPGGRIYVIEHLRDWPNFLAYTIGFFHFHSKKTWINTFESAGLKIIEEKKTTPFISTFILSAHGNTF